MAATIVFVSLDEIAFISSWSFANLLRRILKKISPMSIPKRGFGLHCGLFLLIMDLLAQEKITRANDEFIYDICANKPIQQGM